MKFSDLKLQTRVRAYFGFWFSKINFFPGNFGCCQVNDKTKWHYSAIWSDSNFRRHPKTSTLQTRSPKNIFVGMLARIKNCSEHQALLDLALMLDICYNILLLLLLCIVGMCQLLSEYHIIKSFQKQLMNLLVNEFKHLISGL